MMGDELLKKIDAWAFNVRLECSGQPKPFSVVMGGAILAMDDLVEILEWAQTEAAKCLPTPSTDKELDDD